MSEWVTKGGKGSAYFSKQSADAPKSMSHIFPGERERGDTTYFASVMKGNYIVRTKIVVSDVLITCYELEDGKPHKLWSNTTFCYGGVHIVDNYVIAGDGVFSLERGERLISIPRDMVDIRTRSTLYSDVFLVKTGSGKSLSVDIKSGVETECSIGPLSILDHDHGMALGVDAKERKLIATSLSSRYIAWEYNLDTFLDESGWSLEQKVVPMCISNKCIYIVVGGWLIVLYLFTGELVSKIEYFRSIVEEKLLTIYPGLTIGSHYHANQIATNGMQVCLINYGHPSWLLLLDQEMGVLWSHVTSDQGAGAIIGDLIFTTSESFHRGYSFETGEEVWKSANKSDCSDIFIGDQTIYFEDSSGVVESYSWIGSMNEFHE